MKKIIIAGVIALGILWSWYAFQSKDTEAPLDDENATTTGNEPAADRWSGWETATTSEGGISFRYPAAFGTSYITPVDWPPQLQVLSEPFSCTAAGDETARAGKTELRTIEGREYCVTQITEGAAGSIYSQYAYAFPKDDATMILTFTLRMPQCLNYDDPERTACQDEQETFALDPLIDMVAQSITPAS
jgi:hypothetical protein